MLDSSFLRIEEDPLNIFAICQRPQDPRRTLREHLTTETLEFKYTPPKWWIKDDESTETSVGWRYDDDVSVFLLCAALPLPASRLLHFHSACVCVCVCVKACLGVWRGTMEGEREKSSAAVVVCSAAALMDCLFFRYRQTNLKEW